MRVSSPTHRLVRAKEASPSSRSLAPCAIHKHRSNLHDDRSTRFDHLHGRLRLRVSRVLPCTDGGLVFAHMDNASHDFGPRCPQLLKRHSSSNRGADLCPPRLQQVDRRTRSGQGARRPLHRRRRPAPRRQCRQDVGRTPAHGRGWYRYLDARCTKADSVTHRTGSHPLAAQDPRNSRSPDVQGRSRSARPP